MKLKKVSSEILLIALSVILISACSSKDEDKTTAKPAMAKAKLVKVFPVKKRTMKETLSLTGTIEAENKANVISTTDGKISKLFLAEGDKVKQNQVVAMVSPTLREDIVNAARLNYEKLLVESNKNPNDDGIKLKLKSAKENLEFALDQYKEIPIVASLNGIVSHRYADPGDMISAKSKIYEIQSDKGFKLEIQISELDIKKLKTGQQAKLFVDACPDKKFSSTITRIYPEIDPKTRNGIIELKLNNPCVNIHSGMFARAEFTTRVLKDVLAIPTSAIVERPNKKTCFVIENNMAKEKEITTGLEADNFTQIINGVSEDELVVLEGQTSLKTGAKVKIQNQKKGKEK